jgi:hypothetical protein
MAVFVLDANRAAEADDRALPRLPSQSRVRDRALDRLERPWACAAVPRAATRHLRSNRGGKHLPLSLQAAPQAIEAKAWRARRRSKSKSRRSARGAPQRPISRGETAQKAMVRPHRRRAKQALKNPRSLAASGCWTPSVHSVCIPRVKPAQAYVASGNKLGHLTETPFPHEVDHQAFARHARSKPDRRGGEAPTQLSGFTDPSGSNHAQRAAPYFPDSHDGKEATAPTTCRPVQPPSWGLPPGAFAGSASTELPSWSSLAATGVGGVKSRKEESDSAADSRVLARSLARYRGQSETGRSRMHDELCRGVDAMFSERVGRIASQLRDARTRSTQLGRLLSRESSRAIAMRRWDMQAEYVPERSTSQRFSEHAALAATHATVMYKALSRAQAGFWLRSLRWQAVVAARRCCLVRLNQGLARKLTVRGPVRHAWQVWGRFTLLEKYLARAKTRATAAVCIQRVWRHRRHVRGS